MNIQDLESVASVIKPIAKQIELLSQRINSNRSAWSSNETATRLQLIDPLLREIGWDTADPDQVKPEYSVGARSADYVLMAGGAPIAVVEAKNISVKIDSTSRLQAHSYVNSSTIQFVIVTNGDSWEMYSSSLADSRALCKITISRDPSYLAAIEAAKMSRIVLANTVDNVERTRPKTAQPKFEGGAGQSSRRADTTRIDPFLQLENAPTSYNSWMPLTQVSGLDKSNPIPRRMVFPDRQEQKIRFGVDILRSAANWLVATRRFDETNARLIWVNSTNRYLANNHSIHPRGDNFRKPYKLSGVEIYLEIDLGIQLAVDSACALLAHCAVDPSTVSVKFD